MAFFHKYKIVLKKKHQVKSRRVLAEVLRCCLLTIVELCYKRCLFAFRLHKHDTKYSKHSKMLFFFK